MSAEPLPQPEPVDLGHPIRYPVRLNDAWRLTCTCHWWQEISDEQAEGAVK
jgi:hypothetical protein